MAYSKSKLEVHSRIAGLYARYRDKNYIHFKNSPEIRGTRFLESIIEAIEGKKILRLTYLPFYEDKPYFNEVHPYLLKEHGFRWYLVGWNAHRQQVRTYALDRVRELEELADGQYRAPGFDASNYFRYSMGIIAPEGAPPLILLAVQRTQAQYLITQPWHESQNIHSENDERIVFSYRVHPAYEFRSQVLSLGKDAEILEPANLRESLAEELASMLKSYSAE